MQVNQTASDATLVTRTRRGDQVAFSALVDRHFGVVYAIARARLGQREAAEDLAQEVFIRVHLHLDSLRDPGRFAAWVCRLTRNLAADWTRRGQRRSKIIPLIPLDEKVESTMPAKEPSPREEMEREQDSAAIRDSIDRLSPELREIVLLRYTENLSLREIAKRLDSHHTAVSRKLDRALGEMRGAIETALKAPASSFRPRAKLAARATALAVAVAASSEIKAAVTAAAPPVVAASKAAGAVGASSGFLKGIAALAVSGGKVMAINKGVAVVAIAAVAVGGAVIHSAYRSSDPPPQSQSPAAEVNGPVGTVAAPSETATQLRQIYTVAQHQTQFTSDPYAGLCALFRELEEGQDPYELRWLLPNAMPDDLVAELMNFDDYNIEGAISQFQGREILNLNVPRVVEENSVATIRYVDPVTREILNEMWLYEDGLWKFFLPEFSDADFRQAIEGSGIVIENHRLVSLGNYVASVRQFAAGIDRGNAQ